MTATRTMYEWFSESASAHPTLPAIRVDGVDFTYQEFEAAVARTASDVLDRCGGRPNRVGVLASRVLGTYLSYLAGLRLGITVVPVNPEFPVARNVAIMEQAGVDVLLHSECDRDTAEALREVTGVALLSVADDCVVPAGWTGGNSPEPVRPDVDDLAYIVFTSGSTGTPKGVPIRHRHIAAWLPHVLSYFESGPGARVSQTSDLSWDVSVHNMLLAWGAGGTVVVPTKVELLTPVQHINRDRITHWFSTPSIITISQWLGDLAPDSMPSLRWSMFAGDLLTMESALAWHEAAPQSVVANVYGPTEITVTCLTYRLPTDPADWRPVAFGALPLGEVYPPVDFLITDEHGAESDEGELLFRGQQRFDGYLDPEHDKGRFGSFENGRLRAYDGTEPLTDDHWFRTGDRVRIDGGRLAFLGRTDNQVKVQGYRVELGDVEAAIRRHRLVDESVVVLHTTEDGTTELAGYYTGESCGDDLLGLLESELPAYMVPRFLVWMAKLPLTSNGKIDRKSLAASVITLVDAQDRAQQRLAS